MPDIFSLLLISQLTHSWNLPPESHSDPSLLLAEVSIEEATQKIIRKTNGRVLAAKTVQKQGKRVYVVKVLTADGRVMYLDVDSQSGHIERQ